MSSVAEDLSFACYIEGLGHQTYRIASRGGIQWLECAGLARWPWLLHAFSTRPGGTSKPPAQGLNLSFTNGDRRAKVEENLRRFFQHIGATDFQLAALRQIHSAEVFLVARSPAGRIEYFPAGAGLEIQDHRLEISDSHLTLDDSKSSGADPSSIVNQSSSISNLPAGDVLMTDQAGILLSVRTADCLPILIVDPRRRAGQSRRRA